MGVTFWFLSFFFFFWFLSGGKSWETPGLDCLMQEVGAGKVGAGKCQASSVLSPLRAHLLPVSLESWVGLSVRCLLGFPFLVLGSEAAFLKISFWSVLLSHIQFKILGRKKVEPRELMACCSSIPEVLSQFAFSFPSESYYGCLLLWLCLEETRRASPVAQQSRTHLQSRRWGRLRFHS